MYVNKWLNKKKIKKINIFKGNVVLVKYLVVFDLYLVLDIVYDYINLYYWYDYGLL